MKSNEHEVTMVSKNVEAENSEGKKPENANDNETGNSEKLERELRKKNIVETIPTGSGAAKPEGGQRERC